jgi:DUF1680 family protein
MAAAKEQTPIIVQVNGKAVEYTIQNGYVIVNRTWKNEDRVSYRVPCKLKK